MEENMKISIIVPIYNADRYLNLCLESIINQTYKNIEIILIDDGSTDNSLKICKEYERKDKRIILIKQNNNGLVYSRKIGIKVASGDYVSFVDADDTIELDLMMSVVKRINNLCPDVIAYGLKEVYTDHVCEKRNKHKCGFYDRKAIVSDILPTMISYGAFFQFGILPNLVCKIINREFLRKIDLFVSDDVTVGEDADFSFQVIAKANSLQILDLCLYNYYQHENTMMIKSITEKQLISLKNDLNKAFSMNEQTDIFIKQVDTYYRFVLALKRPDKVEEINSFFGEKKTKRCALYGAGGFGHAVYSVFHNVISIWVDKNSAYYETKGLSVISVDKMLQSIDLFDYIFISVLNEKVCNDIKATLCNIGIDKEIFYFNGEKVCGE